MHTTALTWGPQTGWSTDVTALTAGAGASIALAFADAKVAPSDALDPVRAALPGTTVIGCSTAGQILGRRVDVAPLVMTVTGFETARVVSAFVREDGTGSHHLGVNLARSVLDQSRGDPIAGVMVFGSGLNTNGSALVAGLMQTLPAGTPVSGGLAGDGDRFESTWVYCDGKHGQDCAAAFAVLGETVDFKYGSQGGWDGFGPVRTITRSDGNVLHELDGQPALGLYKQYLGDRAQDLPGSALLFPLTVTPADPRDDQGVVRTVLGVDEASQSMTFAGDVPTGWRARLMWTTVDSLMEGASTAAEDAAAPGTGLAVAVSCVGRRLVLGHHTDEEVECVVDAIGADTPLIGFYSYGEITAAGGLCQLQNQTMTVTTIRESAHA